MRVDLILVNVFKRELILIDLGSKTHSLSPNKYPYLSSTPPPAPTLFEELHMQIHPISNKPDIDFLALLFYLFFIPIAYFHPCYHPCIKPSFAGETDRSRKIVPRSPRSPGRNFSHVDKFCIENGS